MRLALRTAVWMVLGALICPIGVQAAEELFHTRIRYQVQPDSTRSEWVDIDFGELTLRPGMAGSAFVGDAGITVVIATAGRQQLLIDFTLTTLPPAATVVTRQLVLDRGRHLEIAGLRYEIRYKARVVVSFHPYDGELECDFGSSVGARTVDEFVSDIPLHGAPSTVGDSLAEYDDRMWYVDPSAHFEVYFIPNTLGDFGWNGVRDFLEKEFQQFDNAFHLNRAQRVHFFISPCRVPEIAWIPHRNWAIFPTTFKAFGLYNRDHRDISGVPTNLNYFYRYLGYAPLCLAEGAARGFEYDHYYAKKLKWQGHLPRPSRWWSNILYKSYPDSGLYIAAGSFVNFLIATRGQAEFFRLYTMANDLNRETVFPSVYGESMREIEDEWLKYVDTVRVHPHIARYFASRAQAMGSNDEAIELLEVVIDIDTADVSKEKDDLSLLYFIGGEYDKAVDVILTMNDRYRNAGRVRQMGSVALFFGGRIDSARTAFGDLLADEKVSEQVRSAAYLILGWLEKTEGNFDVADSLFSIPEPRTRGTMLDHIEIALHRGQMRRAEGKDAEADSLFRLALQVTLGVLQSRPGGGDLYLRIGEAYVGLGHADTALIYLDVAEFLEQRPYYVGRLLNALGNAHDLLNMRDFALEFYREALETPTSYPARADARKYLQRPYRVEPAS